MHGIEKQSRWHVPILLAGILLAAAATRLWALGDQSVWYDEFNAVRYLDAPTLGAFLTEQQEYNDEMVPLYFVLQYGWSRLFGTEAWTLRLLSVLLSLGALPGAFAVGKRVYGPGAGLAAAAFFALSPEQIYHGQGLRPYALLVLLGVWSGYAVLRYLDTRHWRWAWLAVLLNGLALWTHLFALWLLPAQLIVLAVCAWREWPRLLLWCAAHLVFLLPLAVLVSTWDIDPAFGLRASPVGILFHVLWRDALNPVSVQTALPATTEMPVLLWPPYLLHAVELCGNLVALTFLWSLARIALARTTASDRDPVDAPRRAQTALLFFWAWLPVLLLYGFAVLLRPDRFVPRYTIYAAPAMYVLAGGAIMSIKRTHLRWTVSGLLIGAMAILALGACASVTRPDFRGAARYLDTREAGAGTIVCPGFLAPVFDYNRAAAQPASGRAGTLLALLGATEQALETHQGAHAVVMRNFEVTARSTVEKYRLYLEARRVLEAEHTFPGPSSLFVFSAQAGPGFQPLEEVWQDLRNSKEEHLDDPAFLLLLGGAAHRAGKPGQSLALYERAWRKSNAAREVLENPEIRPDWAAEPYLRGNIIRAYEDYAREAAVRYAGTADEMGATRRAVAFLRRAAGMQPAEPEYRIQLARVLRRAGKLEKAEQACRAGLEANPGAYRLRIALAGVLADKGETEAAAAELEHAIESAPDRPYAHTELGVLLHRLGKHEAALPHLEKAVALREAEGDPGPLTRFTLIEALLALGRREDAVQAARGCRERGIDVPPGLTQKLGHSR